jgi:hypothetical protein
MKTITLFQPWATLISIGAKRIETRSFSTNYRGPLAIHASKEKKYIDMRSKYYVCDEEPFYSVLMESHKDGPWYKILSRGAIIATCELQGCFKIEEGLLLKRQERLFGDYTPGRFRWMLENVRELKHPILAKGALGLWDWTPPGDLEFK